MGGVTPHISEHNTKWRGVVSFSPHFFAGETAPVHTGEGVGWVPKPVWTKWQR
jgi:hypothetical protein